jgi:hypothetical protein
MALPYIPQTVIDKYFDEYALNNWQFVDDAHWLQFMVRYILAHELDVFRLRQFDYCINNTLLTPYWDHFHNFIVYVRLQQLVA